jgi:hypothetical protein
MRITHKSRIRGKIGGGKSAQQKSGAISPLSHPVVPGNRSSGASSSVVALNRSRQYLAAYRDGGMTGPRLFRDPLHCAIFSSNPRQSRIRLSAKPIKGPGLHAQI